MKITSMYEGDQADLGETEDGHETCNEVDSVTEGFEEQADP